MAELLRQSLFATTAAGLASLGIARAEAAALPTDQPAALFGSISQDRVILPPLHDNSTHSDPPTVNGDPVKTRLGVAVGGLGHLALNQILPGFGRAKPCA
jgi:hypothetical protein